MFHKTSGYQPGGPFIGSNNAGLLISMENIKVTFIYPADLWGPKVGGIETFIRGFIRYAPKDFGIKIIGISSDNKKRCPKKWLHLEIKNKEVEFLPLFFERNENRKTLVPLSLRFTIALKLSNFEVNNDVLFFNRIEPAILFRKSHNPKISVVHNDLDRQIMSKESEVFWSKVPWLYLIYEKLVFNHIDFIYAVNTDTLDLYKTKYYRHHNERFAFLPTWTDKEVFSPLNEPKHKIRIKVGSVYRKLPIVGDWILFVGRLQKQKAPKRVIESFWEYYKENKTACLLIIGDGNLKLDVENYIKKLDIEKNVFLLGSIEQTKLDDFYRAADVLLLTSNFEGMPRCALEALGSGIPVVSTNAGEIKMVIRNGISGEVVDDVSPKLIADALTKVLKNKDIYSKSNCINCVSEYTPQKVLDPVYAKIRQIYREKHATTEDSKKKK